MAVLGRLLISSAERVDLPDMLSIDSYAAGDWKFFLKGLVGGDKPFILKGFDIIDPQNAIGTQSCSIRVADSMVFYPGSNAGSFFHGLEEGHPQAAPLVPELRKNATNFVYLTFSTFNTSVDTRAFWDPDKDGGVGGEFTQDVNTESVLKVDVNVSTGSFPANTIPIAKITVGPVVITSITDCRDLLFRLGTGGINPDPFAEYQFRALPDSSYQRSEPPITMVAGGDNPFQGGDKNVLSLKEWMDLIMTKLKELSGTVYWYEDLSTYSLVSAFIDALATTFKSKGQWTHSSSTPGEVTWTEDITIKITQDPRDTILRAGTIQLGDEDVAYLDLQRDKNLNVTDQAVSWTNGQVYVNTVGGAVGYFANLSQGDYIKKVNDQAINYVRVEQFYDSVNLGGSVTTAANARSVRLSQPYQGTTAIERGRYDKGVYLASDVIVAYRSDAPLATVGGNFHWLVMRSDVIENIGSIDSFQITGVLDQADGHTARIVSTAHGLVDGDRIQLFDPGVQAGTYVVEVEDVDTFYIETTNTTTGFFSGWYGLLTTAARDNGYGLQLESANHGFNSGDTIIVAGTTNYNDPYVINKRSATEVQFAIDADHAAETTGTATLARVNVRSEQGLVKIVQGETIDIGDAGAANLRSFIGMGSFAETHPSYAVSVSYNTLDGMVNYNASPSDSLTARASKLTAMMSDKAQDKTVLYLPSTSLITVANSTNGAAQEITFELPGSTLTIVTPGSTGNATITLPHASPGISLLQNQVAYVELDRNSPTTPSIQIANTASLSIDENIFVIAARLTTSAVYLWNGAVVTPGVSPYTLETIVRQNQALKLVEGGIWSWDLPSQTLTWSANAYIQVPNLDNSSNQLTPGSIVLLPGEVAYVDIKRSNPGGGIFLTAYDNASLIPTADTFIVARREGDDVIVGLHSMRLIHGESKALYAGTSLETLSALGLENEADKGQLRILEQFNAPSVRVVINPIDTLVPDGTTWSNEISGLRMKFDGIQIDMETGIYYGFGDGTLAGSGPVIGLAFTPTTFTSPNLYRWYSINFVADTLNADGTMSVKPLILEGTDGSSPSLAVKAPFSSKKIGQVLVQAFGTGSSINVINQSSVVQLASGAGGGGGSGAPKLIGGGTFTWDLATTALSFTSDMYVEQARLNYTDNTIDSSVSPIVLPTTDHVAFIDRLNASSGGPNLTVMIDLITNVKDGQIIIARRDGNDIIVGSTSNRLRDGESAKLFAQRSNFNNQDQTAKLIEGGTWSWNSGTLQWTSSAHIQVPGLPKVRNSIPGGSVAIGTNQVAHVQMNRKGVAADNLTITVTNDNTVVLTDDSFVFARCDGSGNVIVGDGTRLVDGQSAKLYAPRSNFSNQDLSSKLIGGGTWGWGIGGGGVEQQLITFPNVPTFGTWMIQYNGNNTTALAYNATSGQVQTALQLVPGLIDTTVSGDFSVGFTLTFGGSLAGVNVAPVTIVNNSLVYYTDGAGTTLQSNVGYTPANAESFNNGTYRKLAQRFTLVQPTKVTLFDIVAGTSVAAGGTITGQIVADNAGQPTGAVLDSVSIPGSSIPVGVLGSPQWNFITEPVLQAGNYWYIVDFTAATFGAAISVQAMNVNDGTGKKYNNGTGLWDNDFIWTKFVLGTLQNTNTITPVVSTIIDGIPSTLLSLSADAFIDIPGVTRASNRIAAQSINLPNATSAAYVSINRVSTVAALAVTVADIDTIAVNNSDNTYIVARRDGSDVVVGKSFRLISGETKALDAGVSDQLLNVIPATSNADYTGQLRLLRNSALPKRVNVSAVSKVVPDGTEYGLQLNNLLLDFGGAQIDFETGSIYEEDGFTPLGINFTPATIAVNQYRWYSITLLPSAVGSDNRIAGQLLIIPAAADGASAALAPKAPFTSGLRLGQVVVQNSASPGVINNIAQSQIVQLTSSTSGDAAGDANSFIETLKNLLNDSYYEAFTSNVFAIDTDDKVDPASTGEYSIVDSLFDLNSGETLVSVQNLDSEFLAGETDVESVTLAVQWELAALDTAATYEVSRDGGAHWQTIDMERVDTSDTYIGEKKFETETAPYSDSVSTTSSNTDLTAALGAREAVGVQFTLAQDTYITGLSMWLSKIGTIAGNYRITLWANSGGLPISMLEAQTYQTANSLTGSAVKHTFAVNKTIEAGTYHVVLETDATYKASYSVGVNALRVHGAAGLTIETFNGTIWAEAGPIIGAYEVVGTIEDFDSVSTYALANNTGNHTINDTTTTRYGQEFQVSAPSLVKRISVEVDKLGSPTGSYYISIVNDDGGGFPSTLASDLICESEAQDIGTLSAGVNIINVDVPSVILQSTSAYHIVIRTAYTLFTLGVNALRIRNDATSPPAPNMNVYNGSSWAVEAGPVGTIGYVVYGHNLDLRYRITASANDKQLKGVGILYDVTESGISTDNKSLEKLIFTAAENLNEFTLTQFIPDPDLLTVYYAEAGQAFRVGGFSVQGQKIIFPEDSFDGGGDPTAVITLIFDQTRGGGFDNSDVNALLMAGNHLGSTDTSIDRSVPGRGIFLRSPNGTLYEVAVDDSGNVVTYSV